MWLKVIAVPAVPVALRAIETTHFSMKIFFECFTYLERGFHSHNFMTRS